MSTVADLIHSREYKTLRAELKAAWRSVNKPCALCGQADIKYDGPKNESDSFELDHKISRKRCMAMGRPELILDPTNCQPSHVRCNRSKQDGDGPAVIGETTEDW